MEDIAKIVENDQAISMELLHIVNSAFYGIKTGSIKNAILNLGLSNIKNIVLASEIFNKCDVVGEDKEILRKHSSLTNKLMVRMYKSLLNKKLSDNHSSAGLLHDIGKLVICKNFPDKYRKIAEELSLRKECSEYELEEELLGITHNEIGAFLLNWWEIPASIVDVALYHDRPSESNELNRELVSIIHLANYYSWRELDKERYVPFDNNVFKSLGFSQEECEVFIKLTLSEVR